MMAQGKLLLNIDEYGNHDEVKKICYSSSTGILLYSII